MRTTVNLDEKWYFAKGVDEPPAAIPETWYIVNLPHTWNGIDGTDGGGDYYRGTCCYAKMLDRSALPEACSYYLEFEGANSSADVFVNGRKIWHHDGGYSTWRVNITGALEDRNLIAVLVDNGENEEVYPQQADFTFYGGLYRDVNLICVDDAHFELDYLGTPAIKVTPVLASDTAADAAVEIKTWAVGLEEGDRLHYTIKDMEGNVAAAAEVETDRRSGVTYWGTAADAPAPGEPGETTKVEPGEATEAGPGSSTNPNPGGSSGSAVTLALKAVHRWNGKKDPYLYTATAEIVRNDEVVDRVSARFGCRTFDIDPEKGFFLNGESYPLHGAARHQDRPVIGNALLPEHHREDVDLLLEMGANTVRLAHYQHDQYFYDLCDETGLIVWAEIPYISRHMPNGRANTISQMKELITQNYNHPSIVVWGLSNEISMQGSSEDLLENHRELNDLAHEMDPTRKTTLAVLSSCDIHDPYLRIPDVISYNHYYGWYGGTTDMNGGWFDGFHAEFPGTACGMSEYGCEALNWHSSDPKQGDYTEEYQAHYHEELIKQLFSRPYIWATHVWNMFDFGADNRSEGGEPGQNHKGLVTFDRKYKKDAFYAYKAWLSDEPFVHICGKRYVDRVEDVTKVTVYSNLPEVELFANGRSLGTMNAADHFFYFQVPNEGRTKLLAVAGDGMEPCAVGESMNLATFGRCTDESVINKVDTPNEDYILKEKGAVLNWFDITAPKGYLSLNDTVDDIMGTDEGRGMLMQLLTRVMAAMGMGGSAGGKGAWPADGKDTGTAGETGAGPADGKTGDAGEIEGAGQAGPALSGDLMKQMGGFTLIRLINMMGVMGQDAAPSKDELLAMNAALNKIKKQEADAD